MSLSAGIIGLPNVGKSTFFNTITNLQVEAANYPFATIEPNVGVAKVNDERVTALSNLINPKKTTYANCTFVDIAGLVKGASKGEGMGNKFLGNIREVDVICHIIRCFENQDITHVLDKVDPIRDCEIVDLELIIADIEVLEKRIIKLVSKVRGGDKQAAIEQEICEKILTTLKLEKFPNLNSFSLKEQEIIKTFNLLTTKKTLYIANIGEKNIANNENDTHYQNFLKYINARGLNEKVIPISISLEYEISTIQEESERKEFLQELGLQRSALDTVIKSTYDLLNLQSFFTFGKDEVRA
jgi:GTP-binding protein YchF